MIWMSLWFKSRVIKLEKVNFLVLKSAVVVSLGFLFQNPKYILAGTRLRRDGRRIEYTVKATSSNVPSFSYHKVKIMANGCGQERLIVALFKKVHTNIDKQHNSV